MKVRQDAWSHEDDLLLAETVLRYIREGGTQLSAFEEVGDKLNRTSAACGFRWNAEVRQNYDQAVAIAKKQRKERKRALEKSQTSLATNSMEKSVKTDNGKVTSEQFNTDANPTLVEEYSTELVSMPAGSSKQITLEDCISFLRDFKKNNQQSNYAKLENERLKRVNSELLAKNKELEKRLEKLTVQQQVIQDDYQALVQIMDRARKMVLFDENDPQRKSGYHLDKDDNMEQLAK
ncbi:RsfA family transcriptional regulator [Bacillus timonensis]|nr:RsfA family transcriptional regulator [Bacillus timonensis]